MRNKKTSQHQFGGFLIAVVITALFFYKSESKPDRNYLFHPTGQQDSNTQQVNGLKEIQNYAEQQKTIDTQNIQPFIKNVMNKFPIDGAQKGKFKFTSSDQNAVFLLRDKYTNELKVVVQLPKYDQVETLVPFGEYVVEYATGDGSWQGLDRFWGYSTQFYRSNTQHRIYKVDHGYGGYTIHGSGITLNTLNGQTPDRINKGNFINSN
ncbi:hypothetical protein A3K93_04835 [Acinetobacter sp. NCu2D-2]|uniref:hypothetical protein n=1 Tax=Acinetobacter sp. NCu2D-2 TaxID=1608473 RepID=UPI0007CDD858|nr:hypothetical protein [Acinetobacter sp. NCu2D-2]ANF81574.1 hypothetical protein A3K93_04835 [Acinetobacter sp. NCu2D-2]